MLHLCCIGHITLDKVVHNLNERYLAGGTSYYFSHALSRMHIAYQLITAVGESELPVVNELRAKGIPVEVLPSKHSVYFENIYAANQDHRTQRVLQKADPFMVEQLQDVNARTFHLGPLLADDMPIAVIKYLASKGKVSLDVQGYLREVRNFEVHAIDWPEKQEALQYVSILKANEAELEVLTGSKSIEQGGRMLAMWGVKEVVVTLGSMGSVILSDGHFYTIPAYPPVAVTDATGCGDTYMAGYLYQRSKGANIQQAGEFGAAMASLKIATSGPFTGTEQDVLNFMRLSL
ncbi:PfkB family carbohydrate kinase [Mucilaginibacter sp. PAMB04168]|uniref:PfkB family carbohydrate kinase n=1 Tax=Mucilaginibacter sp. PAMB04168 TaxID=3138567 RepID=UPI0031F6D61B